MKKFAKLTFHGMREGKTPINVDIVLKFDNQVRKVPQINEDYS